MSEDMKKEVTTEVVITKKGFWNNSTVQWILRNLLWVVMVVASSIVLIKFGFIVIVFLAIGGAGLAVGLSSAVLFAYTKIDFINKLISRGTEVNSEAEQAAYTNVIVGVFKGLCTMITGLAIAYFLAQFIMTIPNSTTVLP